MFSLSRLYQIIPIEKSHHFYHKMLYFAKTENFQLFSSSQIHPLLSPSVVFFHHFPFLFRFFLSLPLPFDSKSVRQTYWMKQIVVSKFREVQHIQSSKCKHGLRGIGIRLYRRTLSFSFRGGVFRKIVPVLKRTRLRVRFFLSLHVYNRIFTII